MRSLVVVIMLIAASLLPGLAHGQPAGPYVRIVSTHGTVPAGIGTTVTLQCPAGSIPVGYSLKSKHAGKVIDAGATILDKNGKIVDLSTLTDTSVLFGGGQGMAVSNTSLSVAEDFEFFVVCFSPTAFSDGVATLVKGTAQVPPATTGNVYVYCPAGTQALGAVADGGQAGLINYGTSPIFGSAASPIFLGNLADGTTGPPTGWEATAYNNAATARLLSMYIACGKASAAQTQIFSTTVNQGSGWQAESGAIPSGRRATSWGYDAYYAYLYSYYYYYYSSAWTEDGNVAGTRQYLYSNYYNYVSNSEVRGISGRAVPNAPKSGLAPKATVRIVYGLVTVPDATAPPATTTVSVVEFYNQKLDHYFITGSAQEISDLDSGVHVGWARTGQGFKAYGIGSGGQAGRQPVCRAYGNPSRGLDSHFYSASMEECYATLSSFNDAWLLEASEVFEIDLPNTTTGACPAGDVPIYRVWNNRGDSNHRYTTSIATRDQMVAKGYVAEGYGPNSVTLCALP